MPPRRLAWGQSGQPGSLPAPEQRVESGRAEVTEGLLAGAGGGAVMSGERAQEQRKRGASQPLSSLPGKRLLSAGPESRAATRTLSSLFQLALPGTGRSRGPVPWAGGFECVLGEGAWHLKAAKEPFRMSPCSGGLQPAPRGGAGPFPTANFHVLIPGQKCDFPAR